MNRLILIGNGFDLAHGMKTSYNDFILWYIYNSFSITETQNQYHDRLISIKKNPYGERPFNSTNELIDFHYKTNFHHLYDDDIKAGYNIYKNPFITQVRSKLLQTLLDTCSDKRWVDIENEYYRHLREILNDKKDKKERLKNLNDELKVIIKALEDYLRILSVPKPLSSYADIFKEDIIKNDSATIKLDESQKPENSLILNFNYTSTVAQYLSSIHISNVRNSFDLNNIHGQIDDVKNPLVFGFGDELDADYLKLELENTNEYFEHIKSFWYFRTSNYHDLIRFIDSDEFQVFILGHSCGLSDRTMLNMIFEHPNCKSIKIYYHGDKDGKNNFTTLTQEISRHFKNKADMRKKIVPFDKSDPMPQAGS